MRPGIHYQNNFLGPSVRGSTSLTSLEEIHQGLVNKGTLKANESVGTWFENKLTTGGASNTGFPDWDHLTKEDLEGMSPEQQKEFFKHMPNNGAKILADLMKDMSLDEKLSVLDNLSPTQLMDVMGRLDPNVQSELFKHLTPEEQKGQLNLQIQKQIYSDMTAANGRLLEELKKLKDRYGEAAWLA